MILGVAISSGLESALTTRGSRSMSETTGRRFRTQQPLETTTPGLLASGTSSK